MIRFWCDLVLSRFEELSANIENSNTILDQEWKSGWIPRFALSLAPLHCFCRASADQSRTVFVTDTPSAHSLRYGTNLHADHHFDESRLTAFQLFDTYTLHRSQSEPRFPYLYGSSRWNPSVPSWLSAGSSSAVDIPTYFASSHLRWSRALICHLRRTSDSSVHPSEIYLLNAINSITRTVLTLLDSKWIESHCSLCRPLLDALCDFFTACVNVLPSAIQSRRPLHTTGRLDSTVHFLSKAVDSLTKCASNPLIPHLAVHFQRGLCRLSSLYSVENSFANWSVLLALLSRQPNSTKFCQLCLHELITTTFCAVQTSPSPDISLLRLPFDCFEHLPCDLRYFLIDLFCTHLDIDPLLIDPPVQFDSSLLWSTFIQLSNTSPCLLRLLFCVFTKRPYSVPAFDDQLSALLSDVVDQMVNDGPEDALRDFASVMKLSFIWCTPPIRSTLRYHVLSSTLPSLSLRLPRLDERADVSLSLLKLWVSAMNLSELHLSNLLLVAISSVDDLNEHCLSHLSPTIQQSPSIFLEAIQQIACLLTSLVSVESFDQNPELNIRLWKRLLDVLLRWTCCYLQMRPVLKEELQEPWHYLATLLLHTRYLRTTVSVPAIAHLDSYLVQKLQSVEKDLSTSLLDMATSRLLYLLRPEPLEWDERWPDRLCDRIQPLLFLTLEGRGSEQPCRVDLRDPSFFNRFTSGLHLVVRHLPESLHQLFDVLLPRLTTFGSVDFSGWTRLASTNVSSHTVNVFLTRALVHLLRYISSSSANLPDAPICVSRTSLIQSWSRCMSTFSSRYLNARRDYQTSSFERESLLLLSEVADALLAHISCSSVCDPLIQLLHSVLVANDTSSCSIQLSSECLSKLIRIMAEELRHPSFCKGCKSTGAVDSSGVLMVSKLLGLLTKWCRTCDPLAPFSFTYWPQYSVHCPPALLEDEAHSTRPARHHTFAFTHLTSVDFKNGRLSGSDLEKPLTLAESVVTSPTLDQLVHSGLHISTWLRLCSQSPTHHAFSSSALDASQLISSGELIHFLSLESASAAPANPVTTTDPGISRKPLNASWSIQMWFSARHCTFYIRVHSTKVRHIDSCENLDFEQLSLCTCPVTSVRGCSWIELPPYISRTPPSWFHVSLMLKYERDTLQLNCWTYGLECHRTDVDLIPCTFCDNAPWQPMSSTTSSGVVLHIGHRTANPNAEALFTHGSVFIFTGDGLVCPFSSGSAVSMEKLPLYLLLLGPNWSGCFDALEHGARYSNSAWCVLTSIVCSLYSTTHGAAVAPQLLLEGTKILSSYHWLRVMRSLAQSSLLCLYDTGHPNRVLCSPPEQSTLDRRTRSQWRMCNPSHTFSLLALCCCNLADSLREPDYGSTSSPMPEQITVMPNVRHSPSIEHAFEPLGGLNLLVFLLGQIVCDEMDFCDSTHPSLQAGSLDLLFSALQHSVSMSSQFHTPALPNPGIERPPRGLRNRPPHTLYPPPLSFGDCLLARLFKHPRFCSSAGDVTDVLSRHLFTPVAKPASAVSHTVNDSVTHYPSLIWTNTRLFRCLLLFGPPGLWLPSASSAGCSGFLKHGLLSHSFTALSDIFSSHHPLLTAVTACWLDRWHIIPIALSAFRGHFLEHPCNQSPHHWPVSSLLHLCLCRFVSTPCSVEGVVAEGQTRNLFAHFCRVIISLDADMYLMATERVFGAESGSHSPPHLDLPVKSVVPDSTWLRWHQLITRCVRPEQWTLWTSDTKPTTHSHFSETGDFPNAEEGSTSSPNPSTVDTQPPLNDRMGLVDWTRLPNETTATELDTLVRYSKDLFVSDERRSPALQIPSSSEDSDTYVTGCSSTEIGREAEEYMSEDDKNRPLPFASDCGASSCPEKQSVHSSDDKEGLVKPIPVICDKFPLHETESISGSELKQRFVAYLVHMLDTAWSMLLDSSPPVDPSGSLNLTTVTINSATPRSSLISSLRPPLWLVYSLLGHPWVEMREAGLNGYRTWLRHAASNERALKRILGKSNKLNEIIAAQLLLLPPPLHLSDPQLQARSAINHRHICSLRLMNNSFALILDECPAPSLHLLPPVELIRDDPFSAVFLCLPPYAASRDDDSCFESTSTQPVRSELCFKYSSYCFPVLLAVLAGSVADAVLSLRSTSFTAEVDLCVDSFKALTSLLQNQNGCFLLPALDAGLVSVLYSLAWLLELGVMKPDFDSPDRRFANLAPILTCMSRLWARLTVWLMDDSRFSDCSTTYSPEHRFHLITDLVHQLLVISPLTKEGQPPLKARGADPGPISRCLVRRILYSILDTSVRILSSSTESTRDNRKHSVSCNSQHNTRLVELLKWAVNTTVNVLIYSVNYENKLLCFLKSFDPTTGVIVSPHPANLHLATGGRSPSPDPLPKSGDDPFDIPSSTGSSPTRSCSISCSVPDATPPWAAPQCNSSPCLAFQQSLDQALITLLFNTASDIQNGIVFLSATPQAKSTIQSDCFTVSCKAIGRLLLSKTQPPVVEVAMDPVASYLLKLCNEAPSLLSSFLTSAPHLFSLVFWTNLSELQFWLSRLKDSGVLCPNTLSCRPTSSSHRTTRSHSLSRLNKAYSIDLTLRRLEQLLFTVQSLLALRTACPSTKSHGRFSYATIIKHRSLLLLAHQKNKENWSSSLPQPPEHYSASPVTTKSMTMARLSTLINLLLASFAGTESFNTKALEQDGTLPKKTHPNSKLLSTRRLSSQAHRLCVDGNAAWRDAFGERLRLAGPLGTILWARVADRLDHANSLLHNPTSAPTFLCLDPIEGPMRERRRMFPTHLPLADRLVYPGKQYTLAHYRDPHPLASLVGLPRQVSLPSGRDACVWSHLPLYLPLPATPLIQLASASRHQAVGVWACRLVGIVPIVPVDGDLILGRSWLRFQPDSPCADSSTNSTELLFDIKPVDRLWLAWSLSSIDHVEERRYALRDLAVEIFPDGTGANASALFALRSMQERDAFLQALHKQLQIVRGYRSPTGAKHRQYSFGQHARSLRLRSVQHRWLTGQLSNFAYLMELNSLSGRNYHDLMQYPIFPWVLQDYTSTVLDLGHPNSYRRMDRPIAVQLPERAASVAKYYEDAELSNQLLLKELTNSAPVAERNITKVPAKLAGVVCPPYHYPSHCSNEAIVLNFLIRLLPYTFRHLRFQDNNYDVPDRIFHSVATTWRLTTTTVTCVKELVPEFYFLSELFTNSADLSLGFRQFEVPVDSVELPPWSKNNARLFTLVCRAALESDFITSVLSEWIDLIFGYKQTGIMAKEALNLYHPYTYFGAVDVDKIEDPIRAQAVEAMINNYGQTPKQLFRKRPHPSRFSLVIRAEEINALSVQAVNSGAILDEFEFDEFESFDRVTFTGTEDSDSTLFSPSSLPTAFMHSEVTPLETVIGLRWGHWAGSPHAAPLKLAWKILVSPYHVGSCGKSNQEEFSPRQLGFMCGAVWNKQSTKNSLSGTEYAYDESVNMFAKALMNAWNGCVVAHVSDTTLHHACGRPASQHGTCTSSDSNEWNWTVLGCESMARLWLTTDPSDGHMELVKIMCSALDPSTLWLITKSLSDSDFSAGTAFPLTLPVYTMDGTITALTISDTSPKRVELFVGTSWGSVYIRQLPKCPQEIPSTGWIPENFRHNDWPDIVETPEMGWTGFRYGEVSPTANGTSEDAFAGEFQEAGLWEVTGWRQLVGHGGQSVTALSVCRHYGLFASGDQAGRVCLWDLYRFTLISFLDTTPKLKRSVLDCSPQVDTSLLSTENCADDFISIELGSSEEPSWETSSSQGHEQLFGCNRSGWDVHQSINGLCFSPTSGELAVARWNEPNFKACWIGVYRPSGVQVLTRILDFFAEITDGDGDVKYSATSGVHHGDSIPPLPMAYSTIAEGCGVNCLLLGGPGGRIIWLNSWTLDTVRTMLLSNLTEIAPSWITSVCFVPSGELFLPSGCHPLGEMLCQGLCVADQNGWVYYLVPDEIKNAPKSLRSTISASGCHGKPRTQEKRLNCDRAIAGIWLS